MKLYGDETILALKISPPVAVGSSILAGIELSDVVLVATLVYTVLQIFLLIKNNFLKKKDEDNDGSN